ncbi:MAG TPA: hypothetical protein PLC28_19270 [Spirochaetota bacterium]|nr:hypothetical protein [Spirochaetota bacterium]HQJ72856.1 hypothetical protein [Spirochaetota bacterium]HRS79615.1 hypothetical protein [Spirochaetota bacterium]HRT77311.1 hypothetical protein [Spirochaetota bacterium]
MKQVAGYILVCCLLASSALTISCSDSERNLGITKQTSTVVINLNLPDKNASLKASVLDRIFSFFVKDAVAQTAPAAFSSVAVLVTGPDIAPIEKSFASSSISFDVPSGAIRQFDVTAHVAPGDPSAAASFRGTSVANLPAGTTVNVPVAMTVNETKLVIPDLQNRRIVIMDDMTGSGWLPRTQTDFDFYDFFFVYDIDFDARGRIYFTNSYNATNAEGGVWVMENINDLTPQHIFTGQAYAIAVDRVRNLVYFSAGSTQSEIWMWDGTKTTQLSAGTYFQTNGIDVEQSTGLLYLACNISGYYYIAKYRPGAGDIATYPASGGLSEQIWDVAMKGGLVYATVINGSVSANNRVICLSSDLNPSSLLELHRDASSNFIGPKRFVAPLNRRFYVTDDSTGSNDAIVSFGNIFDIQWILYTRDFQFYQGV